MKALKFCVKPLLFFTIFLSMSFTKIHPKHPLGCNAYFKIINSSGYSMYNVNITGYDYSSIPVNYTYTGILRPDQSYLTQLNNTSGNYSNGLYVTSGYFSTSSPSTGTLVLKDHANGNVIYTYNYGTSATYHSFTYSSPFLCYGVELEFK